MVRLLVILAPAFALLASIGVLGLLKPFFTLLREAGGQVAIKSKRNLKRIGREYSAIAVIIVFLMLMSNYAFMPQTGGTPRVFNSVYSPITISAASLPITPNEPIPQWRNMLSYTRNNLQSTTVVSSWWDYGDWLGMFGNVTTLCDNTTTNTTQIENVAYSMMANETQSLKMLQNYDVEYVCVFLTLQLQVSSSNQLTGVSFAGFGDEGKWYWMARISGEAESRFLSPETFGTAWMNDEYRWTNETTFATTTVDNTTGRQVQTWTDMGLNSTIFKLMSNAEQAWASRNSLTVTDQQAAALTYFTPAYIAGLEVDYNTVAQLYGGLVPLVALYKIDWAAYYTATNSTAPP
jgi:asparagine N-glycosylation enzyme membrane subunit Stt3